MKTILLLLAGCLIVSLSHAQVVNTFPYTADFESEMQGPTTAGTAYVMQAPGWENDLNDDVDWIADTAGTVSGGTGPSVDHTTNSINGFYMYVEASTLGVGFPQMVNNLLTPYFDFTALTNPKLSFWYHMLGVNMGTLYVDAQVAGDSTWTTLGSWTDNVNLWQQDSVALCAFAGMDSVRLRFRGVTGANFASDMAIDDIMVFESTNVSPASVIALNYTGGSDTLCAAPDFPVEIEMINIGCQVSGDVVIMYWTDTANVMTDTISGIAFGSPFIYAIPGGVDVSAGGYIQLSTTTSDMSDTLISELVYFDAPATPVATGATICANETATLSATGQQVTWYNGSGNVVGTGNSFTTPALATNTTYYVENRQYLPDTSLATTFAATTSCTGGNMFDIVARTNLSIDSLFVYANSGAMQEVLVWYKWGSFSEAPTDSAQWTLLVTDSVDGTFAVTPVVDLGGFAVSAGDTLALYVQSDLAYTSGYSQYENEDILFMAGNGNCTAWDNCCSPRTWNGVIYYKEVSECVSDQVQVAVTVDPCLGIKELTSVANVYPNPANTTLNIEFEEGTRVQSVELISLTGQTVYRNGQFVDNVVRINIRDYPKGMYSLSVMEGNKLYFTKIIIE